MGSAKTKAEKRHLRRRAASLKCPLNKLVAAVKQQAKVIPTSVMVVVVGY
jgi:hypothetical protein